MNKIKKFKASYSDYINKEIIWNIALKTSKSDWIILKDRTNRFWYADPFVYEKDDHSYLFYEKYNRKKCVGSIACREILDNTFGEEIDLLTGSHFSFPNVFSYNDQIFMIPETSERNTLEIYKCIEFPQKWELFKVIKKNVQYADSIVWKKNEKFIEFLTSKTDKSTCNVQQLLIHCDSHFNIISELVYKDYSEYGNRNAGRIIEINNKKIRVGQDCRDNIYGRGIVKYIVDDQLNEIELNYQEVSDFLPNTYYTGIHTLNVNDKFIVIDLKYDIERNFLSKMRILLKLGRNYVKRRIRS